MKVLFLDIVHPILEEYLLSYGVNCFHDYLSNKTSIEKNIAHYEGIVIRSRITIDKAFLNKATNLKFIARSGAGLENIDVDYAKEKGIIVFNSPEGNMDAVGEHAIGMLLMLFNNLKKGDIEVRKGIWDREGNRGLELANKTVGIIGYGNMGAALAKKLSGFDCKVIAYDKYKSNFENNYVKEVTLKELQAQANIISLHLPLSNETTNFVNAAFINNCDKPFYLINTARGKNVNLTDLVKGLKQKKVLGACLDVLSYESKSFEKIDHLKLPAEFTYLSQSENVILSPHVAGWTIESYKKLSIFLANKIKKTFFE